MALNPSIVSLCSEAKCQNLQQDLCSCMIWPRPTSPASWKSLSSSCVLPCSMPDLPWMSQGFFPAWGLWIGPVFLSLEDHLSSHAIVHTLCSLFFLILVCPDPLPTSPSQATLLTTLSTVISQYLWPWPWAFVWLYDCLLHQSFSPWGRRDVCFIPPLRHRIQRSTDS